MPDTREQKLIVDEDYMAGLLDEELCNDGPLADLQIAAVTQLEDGGFEITLVRKAEKEGEQ